VPIAGLNKQNSWGNGEQVLGHALKDSSMQERLAHYCLEKGDRDCDGRSGAGEIASTIIS
jgi:hypothetical protein